MFCVMKRAKRNVGLIYMVYLVKILVWSKRAIMGLTMSHPIFDTLRIFFKCYSMKGVKKYMELILFLLKKFSFGTNGPFWA